MELNAGIETEGEFRDARSEGTTPDENPRQFQNDTWRCPSTPNQLLSTEISLEMNADTKNKIKAEESSSRYQTDRNDNRWAQKTHLHIIVFAYNYLNDTLLFHMYV